MVNLEDLLCDEPRVWLHISLAYLLSNISEIAKIIFPPDFPVNTFICLGVVVASYSFGDDIIKKMLLQVDFGEVPAFCIWVIGAHVWIIGFKKLNVCLYQGSPA